GIVSDGQLPYISGDDVKACAGYLRYALTGSPIAAANAASLLRHSALVSTAMQMAIGDRG
ncbi:hypothetical protein KIPB_017203, partial [Kipferlia bialata]